MICQDSASILVHQLVARQQVHDLKKTSQLLYFPEKFHLPTQVNTEPLPVVNSLEQVASCADGVLRPGAAATAPLLQIVEKTISANA